MFIDEFNNTSVGNEGGIQEFKVPSSGPYKITAYGAQGGTGSRTGIGGLGAKITGEFDFEKGEKLFILVGHRGENDGINPSGGGGTFIARKKEESFLELDGSDYVSNISLPQYSTNNLKVSFKIKPNDISSNSRLINTPNDDSWAVYLSNEQISVNLYEGGHENFDNVLLNNEDWNYIDFIYKENKASLFINGFLAGEMEDNVGNLNFDELEFGRRDDDNYYNGIINDIKLYIDDELKHHWPINDKQEEIKDIISENNGTLIGGQWVNLDIYEPLLIAGGGGAYGVGDTNEHQEKAHAHLENEGKEGWGEYSTPGKGGESGFGGQSCSDGTGGGGGFYTSALGGYNGKGLITGGTGGTGGNSDGGFGGGGGGYTSGGFGSTAGGGGFSGGGAGYSDSDSEESVGGGGGSFIAPEGNLVQEESEAAFNQGYGSVQVLKYCPLILQANTTRILSKKTSKSFQTRRNLYNYGQPWPHDEEWKYIEEVDEDWLAGDITALLVENNSLTTPGEISVALGPRYPGNRILPKDRTWVAVRNKDGTITLLCSDEKQRSYVYNIRITNVPTGSHHPALEFDENNEFVIFVEARTAGGNNEIWIIEPPYSGDSVRKICDGRYPGTVLFPKHPYVQNIISNPRGLFLTYMSRDLKTMYYRLSSEDYSNEYVLRESDKEMHLRAAYIHRGPVGPPDFFNDTGYYVAVFFNDGTLKYISTDEIMQVGRKQDIEEAFDIPNISIDNIFWQEILPHKIESQEKFGSPQIQFDDLFWQEILPHQAFIKEEFGGPQIQFDDIFWQEIKEHDVNISEEIGTPNISLDDLVWIEITE